MRISVLMLIFVLGGCAQNMQHQNITTIPPSKGLVFFSTEAAQRNAIFHTALSVIEAETRRERGLGYFIDAPQQRSNFTTHHGHVRTLMLDAGTYFLAPRAGNNLYECLRERVQYRFTVRPGEVTYLGTFRLESGALFHSASANRDRDMAYFLERNPAFSADSVTFQTVESSRDTKGEC
jgi:hypothetical protein